MVSDGVPIKSNILDMKRITLPVLLLFIAVSVCAGKMEYMMRPIKNGYLFFVMPFRVPSETKGVKAMSTDITIRTDKQTADIRMTLTITKEIEIDSIRICNNDTAMSYPARTLYAERRKGNWKYRIELTIPYEAVTYIYTNPEPYRLLTVNRGNRNLSYSPARRIWSRTRREMSELFYVISVNRKNRTAQ